MRDFIDIMTAIGFEVHVFDEEEPMNEKLIYVRMKEYDGRLYRIASDAVQSVNGELVLFIVDGPGTGSYTSAHPDTVVQVDATDVLGSVSPAD